MTNPKKFFNKLSLLVSADDKTVIDVVLLENGFVLKEEDSAAKVYLLAHPKMEGWCLGAKRGNELEEGDEFDQGYPVELKLVKEENQEDQRK